MARNSSLLPGEIINFAMLFSYLKIRNVASKKDLGHVCCPSIWIILSVLAQHCEDPLLELLDENLITTNTSPATDFFSTKAPITILERTMLFRLEVSH